MNTLFNKRADKYDNLQWAHHDEYIERILMEANLNGHETVLDMGTGTGKVAFAMMPLCKKVIGYDSSPSMLEIAKKNIDITLPNNIEFKEGCMTSLPFEDESFDLITTRMVFHHILDGLNKVVNECYRVLKKGGKIIVAEGIPPNHRVKKDFIKIFEHKEDRITFMEEDLVRLLADGDFHKISTTTFFLKKISVNNWLENSALPKKVIDMILDMHINASNYFKKTYRLQIENGEVFIDMKHAIISGIKR